MEPGSLPLGIATEALSVPEEPSPPAETIATEQLPAPGNDSAIEAALAAEVASKSTELDGGPAAKRSKCAEKKAEKKSSKKRKPLLETNKMCSLIILHGSVRQHFPSPPCHAKPQKDVAPESPLPPCSCFGSNLAGCVANPPPLLLSLTSNVLAQRLL